VKHCRGKPRAVMVILCAPSPFHGGTGGKTVRFQSPVLKKLIGQGKSRLNPATRQKAIQLKAQGLPTNQAAAMPGNANPIGVSMPSGAAPRHYIHSRGRVVQPRYPGG